MTEVALGVEISESRSRCSVVKAYWSGERVTVDLVWYQPPAGAPAQVKALYKSEKPCAVALDPRSQSATLVKPLEQLGVIVTRLGAEDVAVAHGEFLDLLDNGGLRHLNQPELTEAARGAQQRRLAGAMALERRVVADQSPLTASEFAVWALLHHPRFAPYDVMESVK